VKESSKKAWSHQIDSSQARRRTRR